MRGYPDKSAIRASMREGAAGFTYLPPKAIVDGSLAVVSLRIGHFPDRITAQYLLVSVLALIEKHLAKKCVVA